MTAKPPAVLLLAPYSLNLAYGGPVLDRLRATVDLRAIITPGDTWREHRAALAEAQVLFSSWGMPVLDTELLDALPQLRAIFYAAGSVRSFVTDAMWARGIRLSAASAQNAIPVAEYATAALILGLKHFWHYPRGLYAAHSTHLEKPPAPTPYRSTIGLISYGKIARLVRQRLRTYDVSVAIYDPFLSAEEAQRESVRKVDTLDELFATADALSLHTPLLPETEGMLQARHFEAMRPGAFFLNTARGALIDEPAMIEVFRRRTDLTAVLDVTYPEPPAPASPLFTLPNIILTPHLAGSVGPECQRMGDAMIDEFLRYRAEAPLHWELNAAQAELLA
ncbi:hypothetical protein AXK12_04385 [Cephaloticoccus capnophilus]|uniref:D-isomer specific 2-hydroxyacid dehydrogenase NAD-binding domain-containing protein n=1 Tax=Cephaloticoccus capnophilus TaxID=1548208 RepID=A0A139SNK8_9BACT|nr:hydroxyacid dehydrogenase [Cephaloticoccus capnophilus]KXU36064.1 hypothetical protein AXK12_04385 [Cephaloticoccus capnophilus]